MLMDRYVFNLYRDLLKCRYKYEWDGNILVYTDTLGARADSVYNFTPISKYFIKNGGLK